MKTKIIMAISIVVSLTLPALAKAQVNTEVIARLTRYEVKADFQVTFRKLVTDYVNYSTKQESNILSEAFYEEENTSVIWIIERWDNNTALEKASRNETFTGVQTFYKQIAMQPVRIIDVKDLEPLSKQQWRRAVSEKDTPLTIMLFVDSKAGTEDEFKKVYHAAMPEFRSEAGVINYQLSQLKNDNTQFVTYEKFRNEEAFQYHLKFPPIQPVIEYLQTSIKKQPFQTGLHRLIAFTALPE